MVKFDLNLSYSQIGVFDVELTHPFNDWTDQHVAQGFSWREGSVSFRTLVENGVASVEVIVAEELPNPSGIRAITVPFTSPALGKVGIASIADGRTVSLAAGTYQLLFETGSNHGRNWCRFTFILNGSLQPSILRFDSEVTPNDELSMVAGPA